MGVKPQDNLSRSLRLVQAGQPLDFMWQIYIIECKDDKLYTGITNNLNRRLSEHNSGHGGRFTKFRRPVKLVYHQEVSNKSEALRREIEIKKLARSEKISLIRSFGFSHGSKASGQSLA